MVKKSIQQTSRREKITKAGSTVFVAVAIASVLVMFCLMSIRFLWEKKSYNDRVITAKTKARDNINTNLTNLDQLSEQFPQLNSSASTNSKKILHALPPVYDYAALASSMDLLAQISGVAFNGSVGEDISANAVLEANISKPEEIPLTLQVAGSYDKVKQYITNLERSIRPIQIVNIEYKGTNASLDVDIGAKTYYQPPRTLDASRSEIQ